MPKLAPSDPESVMVIRKVCDDIITCSLPFARLGVLKFGGRATIVRLQTGAIAVFSPVALTPSVSEAVASLNGTVKYLIAPDMEHHLFLADWAKAYPDAVIIAPEGLWEKRQKNPTTSGPKFEHIYTAQNKETLHISDEFAADFDVEYIHAHVNREIVLLHKPTATLIQADLFFNPPGIRTVPQGRGGTLKWTRQQAVSLTHVGEGQRYGTAEGYMVSDVSQGSPCVQTVSSEDRWMGV
ncbi:hypothetical protein TESG_05698 [Trichophyton tonsurans CBS 112818]|uniref:Metallo-beta-lactamase domain-containing protein n=1 Tax=Trichophyton tonsurans (strain CBS 112818) TaxID=647933 RepID=F2S420_TRIT1|nr:hypothetical protein TESG_05698 [Trichophyton tonsurans CBS 112818]